MLITADLKQVKKGDWVYDQTGVYEIIDVDHTRKEVELLEIIYTNDVQDYGEFRTLPFSQFSNYCFGY